MFDDWAVGLLTEVSVATSGKYARMATKTLYLLFQLLVSRWPEQIGDPTIADGIRGRLVHNAHTG